MGREIFKIVSGGQTGVDRAALEWAIGHGVLHGGWCPKGRRAEDGPIDLRYGLKETPGANYIQRTEWNARDSDGTVIFSIAKNLTGSSKKTFDLARKHRRPALHISKADGVSAAKKALKRFVKEHGIRLLNVAGPRASQEPEVGAFVMEVLSSLKK